MHFYSINTFDRILKKIMISGLRGKIHSLQLGKVELDVSGVLYEVHISFKSYDKLLSNIDSIVFLYTYHLITDRTQKLFGFLEEREKTLFILLRGLQGIGEMTALRVLSFLTPEELITCVKEEDRSKLEKIPKVKGKTSEKIMFEIKQNLNKFQNFVNLKENQKIENHQHSINEISVLALVQLGFDEKTAKSEISKLLKISPNLTDAELIREVLKR
jgi:holliday junction DNA helicase RuvA